MVCSRLIPRRIVDGSRGAGSVLLLLALSVAYAPTVRGQNVHNVENSAPVYDLDLSLASRSILGTERIEYVHAGADSTTIGLRVFANAGPEGRPTRQRVEITSVRCEPSCSVETPSASAIVLRFAEPLRRGGRAVVHLALSARLDRTPDEGTRGAGLLEAAQAALAGQHTGDYGLLAEASGISMMTGFFPVVAARRGAEWVLSERTGLGDVVTDRLGDVRALVTLAEGTTLVATGTETVVDSTHVRIDAPRVRDFAMLASRRFASAERRLGDVVVRSTFLANHSEGGRRVLDYGVESFRVFEEHFGAFPWAELDLVEAGVGGGAGGVEFSGLATIGSTFYESGGVMGGLVGSMGLPPELAPLVSELTGAMSGGADPLAGALEFITAHEVAHQWWHGLVGSSSREHAFLDEALAQWSARYYIERRYGRTRAEQETAAQITQNYRMMRMIGEPDGRVDRPTDAFGHPLSYAGLVYGKAPHLLERVRALLGDARFFEVLRGYVERHRFGEATPDSFLAAFGRDRERITPIYRRWIEQAHGDRDLGVDGQTRAIDGVHNGLPSGAIDGANGDPAELLRMLQTLSQ